jgi:hypothetical protein
VEVQGPAGTAMMAGEGRWDEQRQNKISVQVSKKGKRDRTTYVFLARVDVASVRSGCEGEEGDEGEEDCVELPVRRRSSCHCYL